MRPPVQSATLWREGTQVLHPFSGTLSLPTTIWIISNTPLNWVLLQSVTSQSAAQVCTTPDLSAADDGHSPQMCPLPGLFTPSSGFLLPQTAPPQHHSSLHNARRTLHGECCIYCTEWQEHRYPLRLKAAWKHSGRKSIPLAYRQSTNIH